VLAYKYPAYAGDRVAVKQGSRRHCKSTRKLLFKGSAVLLAGSLNVDDFLQACREQPVVFEVSRLLLPCRNMQPNLVIHAIHGCCLMDLCLLHGPTHAVLSDCVRETLISAASIPTIAEFIKVKSYNLHAIICDYHHSVFCPQDAHENSKLALYMQLR